MDQDELWSKDNRPKWTSNLYIYIVAGFDLINELKWHGCRSFSVDKVVTRKNGGNSREDRSSRKNRQCVLQHPCLVFRWHPPISRSYHLFQNVHFTIPFHFIYALHSIHYIPINIHTYIYIIINDFRHYDGTRAYALSKLANILHTHQLALTLQVHPYLINSLLYIIPFILFYSNIN